MSRNIKYTPEIKLADVKQYIRDGEYILTQSARDGAEQSFGWYENNIVKAILALKKRDFSRSVQHFSNPSIWVDHYESNNLLGEKVYMHFHVEDNLLIIPSFKTNT